MNHQQVWLFLPFYTFITLIPYTVQIHFFHTGARRVSVNSSRTGVQENLASHELSSFQFLSNNTVYLSLVFLI